MSANIKATDTEAIIGVNGGNQLTISDAGVVTANSFVGLNSSNVTATGSDAARTLANRFADVINVKNFLCDDGLPVAGDGSHDDTTGIQSAINAASGKTVFLPAGTYRTTATLTTLSGAGTSMRLMGDSYQIFSGIGGTIILADHASGPVIKFQGSNQGIENITITSTTSRALASFGNNHGILVEPPDIIGGGIERFTLRSVLIFNQPYNGFISSGYTFMMSIDRLTVQSCKGHACILDCGQATGRTNKQAIGGHIITQLRTFNCNGHCLVLGTGLGSGDILSSSFGAYRCTLIDADLSPGTINPSIPYGYQGSYNSVIHGDSINMQNYAFDGASATLAGTLSVGAKHYYNSNRYIGCDGIAEIRATAAFQADDFNFINSHSTTASVMNPAITGIANGSNLVFVNWSGENPVATGTITMTSGVSYFTQITGANANFYGKTLETRILNLTNTTDNAITATRNNAAVGMQFTRTGSGATTGRIDCIGGTFQLSSDTNLVLTKTSGKSITVKSNTINMASLPTSSSTLVPGDLWNNSGVLNIIP